MLVLIKVVDDELRKVVSLVLVLIKVVEVDIVEDDNVLGEMEDLGLVLMKVVDLVEDDDVLGKVEVLVLVLIKVVGFLVDNDVLGKGEVSVLVLVNVVDFIVIEDEELVSTVLVFGVLIKTGELAGADVELMRVL